MCFIFLFERWVKNMASTSLFFNSNFLFVGNLHGKSFFFVGWMKFKKKIIGEGLIWESLHTLTLVHNPNPHPMIE